MNTETQNVCLDVKKSCLDKTEAYMYSYAFNLSLPGGLKLFSGCASPGMVSGANKQKGRSKQSFCRLGTFPCYNSISRSCKPNYTIRRTEKNSIYLTTPGSQLDLHLRSSYRPQTWEQIALKSGEQLGLAW
jgi:hypothetical protein